VQDMGFWWYPSTVPEVGIDGHIEIRDSQTGRMRNLILQIQSKATERPWTRESDDSFEYICEEEDLQYWLAGTAEVLLVMSRPSKDEAYWVPVKEYFESNPQNRAVRRISVSKKKRRFDKDAAGALLKLAAPRDAGAYLSPRPRKEKLYTNLLKVEHYARELHIARSDFRESKQVWEYAKESARNGFCPMATSCLSTIFPNIPGLCSAMEEALIASPHHTGRVPTITTGGASSCGC
jgi:hypothetical protein